jgi:hypothetical protein
MEKRKDETGKECDRGRIGEPIGTRLNEGVKAMIYPAKDTPPFPPRGGT